MDFPFGATWTFYKGGVKEAGRGAGLSQNIGSQFINVGHGRSVNPYFYASITPDGSGTAVAGKSIRFKPGDCLHQVSLIRLHRTAQPASETAIRHDRNLSSRGQ